MVPIQTVTMRRSWFPLRTSAQLRHTLVICGVGVVCTVLVAMIELYFLNLVATGFVQEVNDPEKVTQFLRAQEPWLYYGLIALMVLSLLGLFVMTVRFTNRIFGPQMILDRDIKKLTFLGKFDTNLHVRHDDFLKGLIRQYRLTCEDMDTVHRLYSDAYKEVDETLEQQQKRKKVAS